MTDSKRKTEYLQYLGSEEWGEQRSNILSLAEGLCEFCHSEAKHVHHIKYPKHIGEENPRFLAAVCPRCHDIAHGINRPPTLVDASHIQFDGAVGRKFDALEDDRGVIWASADSWRHTIGYPKADMNEFSVLLITAVGKWRMHFPQNHIASEYKSKPVYRWSAIDNALTIWYGKWECGFFAKVNPDTLEVYEKLANNIYLIKAWASEVVEKHLKAEATRRMNPASNPITPSDGNELLIRTFSELIAPRFHDQDRRIEAHDIKITTIEAAAPYMRAGSEFITVKQAYVERGENPSACIQFPSRLTSSSIVGTTLSKEGFKKGKEIHERLDGSAVIATVNTYQRSDIYAVMDRLLAREKS